MSKPLGKPRFTGQVITPYHCGNKNGTKERRLTAVQPTKENNRIDDIPSNY